MSRILKSKKHKKREKKSIYFATLLLFNTHNYKYIRKFLKFPEVKYVRSSVSHLLKQWSLSFPSMSCNFKTGPVSLCTWVTLVHRNTQATVIMIDCVELRQEIWVLAKTEWADIRDTYKNIKIWKHIIWLKQKRNSYSFLSWFWKI